MLVFQLFALKLFYCQKSSRYSNQRREVFGLSGNIDIEEKAREGKKSYMREYMREYRKKNPKKITEINQKYWAKRAERELEKLQD